jgi:hypothetical protein
MDLYQTKELSKKIFLSYKNEILASGDWFFNLDDWTLNFILDETYNRVEVLAYSVYKNETQWDDHHWLEDIELGV